MPESPGVYIEELSAGPPPITGQPTSVAAFVGMFQSRPINQYSRLDLTKAMTTPVASAPLNIRSNVQLVVEIES